jgi:large repetitive protein
MVQLCLCLIIGTATQPNQPSSLTGLSAGAVQLTVIDGQGCSVSSNYFITEPAAIAFNLSTNLNSCSPYNREIVLSNLSGGSGPIGSFSYSYSGPSVAPWQAADLSGMDVALPTNPLLGGLTVGGNYLVTVYDAYCSKSASINVNGEMSLASTIGDVLCHGGNTGSVVLNVTGGSGSYTYSWTKIEDALFSGSTKDLAGIGAGTYVVVVTDVVQGCSKSLTANVQQSNPIVVAGNVFNIGCFGAAEGDIELSVSGGNGPYTFLWTTADGSGINPLSKNQSGLTAGTYQVMVTDASLPVGCSVVQSFSIAEVAPLTFDLVLTDRYCNGTGDLELQGITGGSGNYQIVWSGPGITAGMQNLSAIAGVPSGTYTATLVDMGHASCQLSKSVSFAAAVKLESLVVLPQTCSSAPNGSIDVTLSGGILPLSFAWTTTDGGGNFMPANLDQNGITAGTYNLTITDGVGCKLDVPNVTVNSAPSFSISSIVLPELCYGAKNGSIDLTISGGTGSFAYSWMGPDVNASAQNQPALGRGNYAVTVRDLGNGCDETASFVVAGPDTPLSVGLISQVNIACNGDATGEIMVSAMGGSPNYTYVWSGPGSLILGNQQSGLVAGTYSVYAKDINECQSAALNFVITEPAQPLTVTLTSVVDVASYGDASGQIHVAVNGGTGTYTLVWSGIDYLNNAISIPVNTYSAMGLLAGNYQLIVTDGNGCIATLGNIIVRQPGELFTLNVSGHDVRPCTGNANGSVVATVTGGDAPYTLKLFNGAGTLLSTQISGGYTFAPLVPDVYTIEATDGNGVVLSQNVTISEPSPISLVATVAQNVTCTNGTDGVIQVSVSGGVPNSSGFYKVIVSGNGYYDERIDVPASTTAIFSSLVAGNYWVRVIDDANGDNVFNIGNDCSANATLNIAQPEAMVTISGSSTVCSGDLATLSFTVNNWPNIALNPLEVTLSNGNVVTVTSSPMFYNYVPSTSENLTISNVAVGACNKGTGVGNAQVTVRNRPTATIIGNATICAGQTVPLTFYLSGLGPWDVTYTDGSVNYQLAGILSSPYSVDVTPIATTTYALLDVQDANCSQSYLPTDIANQATVVVNVLPSVTMFGSTSICNGQSTPLEFNFTSGTAPWSVTVNKIGEGPFTLSNIGITPYSFAVSPSQTSVYELVSVTDGNGCSTAANGVVNVLVNPLPVNPGVISGPLAVCQGQAGVSYSIAPVANAICLCLGVARRVYACCRW